MEKSKKFATKNEEKPKFKFQVNVNRLPKKPRAIRSAEDSLLTFIRNYPSLKMLHRGWLYYDDDEYICIRKDSIINLNVYYDLYDSNLYKPMCELVELFVDDIGSSFDFTTKFWSSHSEVLSFIHDNVSVSGSPDYTINKSSAVDDKSVEILFGMFKEYSVSHGAERISDKKYYETCRWLVVYLNSMLYRKYLGIRYTRDNNFKSTFNVVNKDFSIPICKKLINMLSEYKLILDFSGNKLFGSNSMSMLIPSGRLLKMLHIVGDYEVSKDSSDMVKLVDSNSNIISIDCVDDEMRLKYEETKTILEKHKDLINSNVSTILGYELPEYWLHCTICVDEEINGRLFDDGTIQNKSKTVRKLLKMFGEDTVSLDFKSLHPAMLLDRVGISIKDHNPYPSFDWIKVDKKLINKFKKYYGYDKYDPVRTIVKKLLLCLINASNVNNAVGSCYNDLHNDNMKRGTSREHSMKYVGLPNVDLHDIAKKLIEHNYMIAKYFGIGEGNRLQYTDSKIMLQSIDMLCNKNIPCIPIHDALICRKSDADTVVSVMTEAFVSVVGDGSEKNCIIEEE
jgi:hypothetical protein